MRLWPIGTISFAVLALAGCRAREAMFGVPVPVLTGVASGSYRPDSYRRVALMIEPWRASWELKSDLAGSLQSVFTAALTEKGYEVVVVADLPARPETVIALDRPVDARPRPVQIAEQVMADAVLLVAITDMSVVHRDVSPPRDLLDLQIGLDARLVDPATAGVVWSARYAGCHILEAVGQEQQVIVPIATGVARSIPSRRSP